MSSENEAVDVGQDQIMVMPHMSLGTQEGIDIPCPECPPCTLSQDRGDALCLEINSSVLAGETILQLRALIQLVREPVTGGAGLEPLSNQDVVVFEQPPIPPA